MCDIALVYSQWLCFNLLRWTHISERTLMICQGYLQRKIIQSAVIEEQTMSSSLGSVAQGSKYT